MRGTCRLVGLSTLSLFLWSACSDDDGGSNSQPDGGAPHDGRVTGDATVPLPPEWPIGIPPPGFGIAETVESVYGDADFFTYYVDNTATCDDSGNGSPAEPRCTIPRDLVAGDVVFIAAGTYALGSFWIDVTGTPAAPIFIRGPGSGSSPVITFDDSGGTGGLGFDLRAEYLIVEHLEFDKVRFLVEPGSHHVALRFCNIHDHPDRTGVSARGEDIVIFQNEVHHFQGNNRLGVGGACGTARIWVVANDIHHNAEDSVQFGHGCQSDPPHHVYIGGNTMHSDRENAVDLKWVQDVIVTQNLMHGYRPAPTDQEFCYDDGSACLPAGFYDSGSDGSAVVVGSDGESQDVWFLFNRITDSQRGIRIEEATSVWLFGNVIHDILSTAIFLERRATALHIVNNTLHGAQIGLGHYLTDFVLLLQNNIFSTITYRSLDLGSSEITSAATLQNNLFWNGAAAIQVNWSDVVTLQSDSDFQLLTTGTVAGNRIGDPAFVDAAQDDFRLDVGSSAIDAGRADPATSVCQTFQTRYGLDICFDHGGRARPLGSGWDIGAHEQ